MWKDTRQQSHRRVRGLPKHQYNFTPQKDQRTFAENLRHVAAADYDLLRSVSGSDIGPDFGENKHNPSGDLDKTKADVGKLVQQAGRNGANLIQQQGDAGLDKITKYASGNKMVHNSYTWMWACEHRGEHDGQHVVYRSREQPGAAGLAPVIRVGPA